MSGPDTKELIEEWRHEIGNLITLKLRELNEEG
jgi:hypothetical protein